MDGTINQKLTPVSIVVYKGVITIAGIIMALLPEEEKMMSIRFATAEETDLYKNRPEQ